MYMLDVYEKTIIPKGKTGSIFVVPSKLPMISKPKKYSENELASYLILYHYKIINTICLSCLYLNI